MNYKKINGTTTIPHLNIRGVVEDVSGDILTIKLSEKSQEFLNTSSIDVLVPDSKIALNNYDDVFIKFNKINIEGNKATFSSMEIYKYFETIDKNDIGKVTWWTLNDFGGVLKYSGTEFFFNDSKYVDSDYEYSEDGKEYFVDIYDGQLLIEDYKNIFPPMRWFNMVNPQETYFDIIVDIYKTK